MEDGRSSSLAKVTTGRGIVCGMVGRDTWVVRLGIRKNHRIKSIKRPLLCVPICSMFTSKH